MSAVRRCGLLFQTAYVSEMVVLRAASFAPRFPGQWQVDVMIATDVEEGRFEIGDDCVLD